MAGYNDYGLGRHYGRGLGDIKGCAKFDALYPHPDDLIEPEIARSANVYTARELVERIEEEEQKWYDLFGHLACAFSGFLVGMAVTAIVLRIW